MLGDIAYYVIFVWAFAYPIVLLCQIIYAELRHDNEEEEIH